MFSRSPTLGLRLSDDEFLTVFEQITAGLSYLHRRQEVSHGNIHPGNVLIISKAPSLAKIVEFALLGARRCCCMSRYDVVYQARRDEYGPEGGHTSHDTDIWSLCVLHLGGMSHTINKSILAHNGSWPDHLLLLADKTRARDEKGAFKVATAIL